MSLQHVYQSLQHVYQFFLFETYAVDGPEALRQC